MKNLLTIIFLFSVSVSFAQRDTVPSLRLYKVNSGNDFITVEFYSMKQQMFARYEVIRTDGDKAKSLGTFGKKYSVGDTVVFFYTDTNVVANKLYQYSFIPAKEDGKKAKAGEAVFAATKVFTAYYFRKTEATANKLSLGIDVKWKLSSTDNIKAIRVYRSEKSDTGFTLLSTLPSTDTLYIDYAVLPDKPYFYKLSAENHITHEIFESAAFFDLGMPTAKPLKPTLQNVVQTAKGVQVKVDVSEKYLSAVRIYRKANGGDKFTLVATAAADSVVVVMDSSVINTSGDYVYVATTENAARFESDYSNEVGIQVVSTIQPDYAGDFTAEYDNTRVKLFWEKLDFNQFKVKRTDVIIPQQVWLNGGVPFFGNRFVDSTVMPSRKYEYTLYPLNENGDAGKGVTVIVQTPDDDLVANESLRGFSTSQGVVLEWGVVADRRVVKQKLYRAQAGGAPTALATLELKVSNYKDATALAGEVYRYYLVSVDSKGKEGKPGNEIAVRAQQK